MLENLVGSRRKFTPNVERNEKLYRLWKEGKTIRQAAALTGYPEGTVIYYWRKYNRAAAAGKPIVIDNPLTSGPNNSGHPEPTREDQAKSYLWKSKLIEDLIREGAGLDPIKKLELVGKMQSMGLFASPEEIAAFFVPVPPPVKDNTKSHPHSPDS
jgi:hypothetical protein